MSSQRKKTRYPIPYNFPSDLIRSSNSVRKKVCFFCRWRMMLITVASSIGLLLRFIMFSALIVSQSQYVYSNTLDFSSPFRHHKTVKATEQKTFPFWKHWNLRPLRARNIEEEWACSSHTIDHRSPNPCRTSDFHGPGLKWTYFGYGVPGEGGRGTDDVGLLEWETRKPSENAKFAWKLLIMPHY